MDATQAPKARRLVLASLLGVLLWGPAGYVLHERHERPPAPPKPLLSAKAKQKEEAPDKAQGQTPLVRKRRATFEKYLKTIGRHQLFLVRAPAPEPVRGNSITLESLLAKLTLMGVFDGKGGPEAIIGYSGRTYNCKGGEKVGPLVVKEVRKDGVVLQYGDETTEVRF